MTAVQQVREPVHVKVEAADTNDIQWPLTNRKEFEEANSSISISVHAGRCQTMSSDSAAVDKYVDDDDDVVVAARPSTVSADTSPARRLPRPCRPAATGSLVYTRPSTGFPPSYDAVMCAATKINDFVRYRFNVNISVKLR